MNQLLFPKAIMQSFADNGFVQAVLLADIATIDRCLISHQAFEAQASNGLCDNIDWLKSPPTLPFEFIELWKLAFMETFINTNS